MQRKKAMSALLPKADMCSATSDVRFGPIADSCTAPLRKQCLIPQDIPLDSFSSAASLFLAGSRRLQGPSDANLQRSLSCSRLESPLPKPKGATARTRLKEMRTCPFGCYLSEARSINGPRSALVIFGLSGLIHVFRKRCGLWRPFVSIRSQLIERSVPGALYFGIGALPKNTMSL
jgi:hypothetical protein